MLNRKYDPPRRVEVIESNPEALYNLSDFDLYADAELRGHLPGTENPPPTFRPTVGRCDFLQRWEAGGGDPSRAEWYAGQSILGRLRRRRLHPRGVLPASRLLPQGNRREDSPRAERCGAADLCGDQELWNCDRDCAVKSPAVLALKMQDTTERGREDGAGDYRPRRDGNGISEEPSQHSLTAR